jgi:hypothetical protein
LSSGIKGSGIWALAVVQQEKV